MDLPGALRPGSIERRYSALSKVKKNTYFLLRKHLYFSRREVDEMEWWELRMWVEELSRDFKRQNRSEDDDDFYDDEPDEADGDDFSLEEKTRRGYKRVDDLSALGANVKKIVMPPPDTS